MATLIGVAMFIVVVLILHLIQSGYEARHQLISELALGQHGWAMFVAFLGLATANLGVISAIAKFGGSHGYRVLLGVAALLFLTAGIFPLGATSLIHITAIATAFVLSVPCDVPFPDMCRSSISRGPASGFLVASRRSCCKRRLGQLRYTNGYCTKACHRVFATLAWNCRMEALPTMNGLVSESATCSQRMKVSRCHTTTVDPWHVWIVRYNCSMPSHIPGFG